MISAYEKKSSFFIYHIFIFNIIIQKVVFNSKEMTIFYYFFSNNRINIYFLIYELSAQH
jgi:NADH:ubiquinone oxidoreductase subunit 4 (subunit M)